MQTVYIETTIPSYLGAHPSSQPSIAADQKVTHEWWQNERSRFRLYTSVFTLDEASGGDAGAATRRMVYLQGIPQLTVVSEMDYLLTWNCKHLANPVLQKELVEYCRYHNLFIPIICTPEALLTSPP